MFAYFDGPKGATVTLRSLTLRYPNGKVRQPAYTFLAGGLVDRRGRTRAHASRRPTGKFSSRVPSIVTEVGPPSGVVRTS
jgi:hypothetical protein